MITEDCGFAVPVGEMSDTVERLGIALKTLAGDREMRRRMGAAARHRVE